MTSQCSHGVGQLQKHPEYYIRDGSATFVVERTLFRVHRFFLERESEFFRSFFSAGGDSEDPKDGSDEKPFTLDVKSDDFARFCWVWYHRDYSYSCGQQDWLVILSLATRWQFPEIRKLAIRELEKFTLHPVDKIALYKEYKIDDDLLFPSYVSLCRSPTLPSPSEGNLLTMETVLKLVHARERALRAAAASGCESPTSAGAPDDAIHSIITETFNLTPHPNGTTAGLGGQALNGSHASMTADKEVITLQQPGVPAGRGNSSNGQTRKIQNGEPTPATPIPTKTNQKGKGR